MSEQSTPAKSDHRATIIAGLRAMADFLEARPEIPEPYLVREQHSITDEYDLQTHEVIHKTDEEKVAETRRIAALLGVEPTIYDDGTGIILEYRVAELATYIVHAQLTPTGEQS